MNKMRKGSHKKFYLPYTEEMEQELYELMSSLNDVGRLRCKLLSHPQRKHTKWLSFHKGGLEFDISVSSFMKSNDHYNTKYYYQEWESRKTGSLIHYFFVNASLCKYTPKDVYEIVELMSQYYQRFYTKEVCMEMKEIIAKHQLSYVGLCAGEADNDKLTELFMAIHNLENDRFDFLYYFIDFLSEKALHCVKSDDEDREEGIYDDEYQHYFGKDDE